MKTTLLIITFFCGTVTCGYAQPNNFYLIGESIMQKSEDKLDGVFVKFPDSDDDDKILYRQPNVTYGITSTDRRYEATFWHHNFNLAELAKRRNIIPTDTNQMYQVRINKEFLSFITGNPKYSVRIETLMKKSAEELWQWEKTLVGKKIVIVDLSIPYDPLHGQLGYHVEMIWSNSPKEEEKLILKPEEEEAIREFLRNKWAEMGVEPDTNYFVK